MINDQAQNIPKQVKSEYAYEQGPVTVTASLDYF